MPKSSNSPPRRGCEAADALPAALKTTRGSSRPTCRRRNTCRLVVERGGGRLTCCLDDNSRQQSTYLPKTSYLPPRRGCEAAVALPDAWMPKSSYSPPRRGCAAADALPAALKTTRGSSRPTCRRRNTCRLVVDARRRTPYLLP